MVENPTTIQLDKSTRKRLQKHGWKGETYDEIVNRLLNKVETDNS